ncbi:hypothetical protein AAVH_39826 [Aphelenchoides avenae]|nr:hypothetical protein AAVH_39826 [Aphelenchus avenae]
MEHPGGSGSCIRRLFEDSDDDLDLDLTMTTNAEEGPEPSSIMETVVVNYGTPNFTDNTQKEFTFQSQRYPGVVFHYRKYNSLNKSSVVRVYYRCVDCWEASGKETKTNPRCIGGYVVVLDGQTFDKDPDYPQFATGHLCQGGQLTDWLIQDVVDQTHRATAPKRRVRSFEPK